jgi:fructooligosaccharide transport system permease protein
MHKKDIIKILFYIVITLLSLFFIFPMLWMIVSSFKIDEHIYRDIGTVFAFLPRMEDMTIKPYKELLSMYNIFKNMGNSLMYASLTVVFGLMVNSLAGYALAKFNFPFKDGVLLLIIALMIVPVEATILPLYMVVFRIKLINTIAGYLLPFVANVMNIFLFRQYFLSFPEELSEAARIDGLGHFKLFYKIVFPISKPIYVTIGIITFLASWNDFLWPVMALSNSDLMPVQVALNAIFSDTYNIFTSHTMAALTLVTLPVVVLYMFFQRQIVEGVARSGIK